VEASNQTAEEALEAFQAVGKETDLEALEVLAAWAACPCRGVAVVLAGEVVASLVVEVQAVESCQEVVVVEGAVDRERQVQADQALGEHLRRAGEACQLVTAGSGLPEVARQPIRDALPWRPS
jgi:hypothetical protein